MQCYDEKVKEIILEDIKQENLSFSNKNVVRGLHYQWDKPMGKVVQCLRGSIMDVFLDIRKDSKTFGQFEIVNLKDPQDILWIPQGFAHGFYSLEENTMVKYLCSELYNPNAEGSIDFFDKQFNLSSVLGISREKAIISKKDKEAQSFFEYCKNPKF